MSEVMSTIERTHLRHGALWLLAASVGWWVAAAALVPADDFFAGDSARAEAISIADNAGMFRAFHIVAVLATAAGALGIMLLARAVQSQQHSRLARGATVLAGTGLAAWIVEAVLRLTVTVSRARDVVDGTRTPADEPAVGNWIVFTIAALGFVAPMICAWALARARVPAGRGIVVVAAFTTLVTLGSIAILAPSPVYQFAVLVLGLFVLVRTRRAAVAGAAIEGTGA